ncbi:MAG: transketolase C-terminal domain-containing protein [Mucinivorans sp.]
MACDRSGIKPLDDAAILESVRKTGCVVVAEEHFANGGLADSVAQLLARTMPAPVEYVNVDDQFGQSGRPAELMSYFGLDVPDVIAAAKRAISRRRA